MHLDGVQDIYSQLKHNAHEGIVDQMWYNILPLYFEIRKNFTLAHEDRPWAVQSKTRADFIIRLVRKGISRDQVVLIENKRVAQESASATWRDALTQLQGYMLSARASQFIEDKPNRTMYGIVTVGHYSRFYVLLPAEPRLEDYGSHGGRPLEFKADEEVIDALLLDIVARTSTEQR